MYDCYIDSNTCAKCMNSSRYAVELISNAFIANKKLLVCGNGGSCSDSDHIVAELIKTNIPCSSGGYMGFKAISLSSNNCVITSIANDSGYNLVFAILIIVFTYFYTAITINPTQMAEDMKRNNGFIPGIKPGKSTAEYIDVIMSRITLPGSFFLALVAIMPAFAGLFGVTSEFAQFFGGTSLLILVGVVLDTLQQVESHLLMRHYDGLLKTGRIKGRSANIAAY